MLFKMVLGVSITLFCACSSIHILQDAYFQKNDGDSAGNNVRNYLFRVSIL